MDMHPWLAGLLGGLAIGASATLMLAMLGRIAGVSGILGRALRPGVRDRGWRWAFVAGLPIGAATFSMLAPEGVHVEMVASPMMLVVAGLLVGFGTQLGNGCTSGHGVCGLARRSRRSLLATLTFIGAGMMTVLLERLVLGTMR
jgi:uncharacterized membrane protein YedE/YeeE